MADLIRGVRRRKPKRLAVVEDSCTGCGGSPICAVLCPVEGCMVLVPDPQAPPFERMSVDPLKCVGCGLCVGKGPDGTLLEGCPWEAIRLVGLESFEAEHGVLPS